jgi:hypothetical protein
VVFVLLTPQTRIMPQGAGLADLDPRQMVEVTGTINWRTDSMLRPTLLTIGAAATTPPCEVLPAAGEPTCANEHPTPTPSYG